jgi:hypothetical protein
VNIVGILNRHQSGPIGRRELEWKKKSWKPQECHASPESSISSSDLSSSDPSTVLRQRQLVVLTDDINGSSYARLGLLSPITAHAKLHVHINNNPKRMLHPDTGEPQLLIICRFRSLGATLLIPWNSKSRLDPQYLLDDRLAFQRYS